MEKNNIKEITKIEVSNVKNRRLIMHIYFSVEYSNSAWGCEEFILGLYASYTKDKLFIVHNHEDLNYFWAKNIDIDPILDAAMKFLDEEVFKTN